MTDVRALPCPLCGSRAVAVHRTGGEARRLLATCIEVDCACSADFIMWQARPAFEASASGRVSTSDFQGQTQGQNEGAGTNAVLSGGVSIGKSVQAPVNKSREAINLKKKAP